MVKGLIIRIPRNVIHNVILLHFSEKTTLRILYDKVVECKQLDESMNIW